MSKAIAVFHGNFGRATLYHLDRTIIPHAHSEGHLLFHVHGSHATLDVNGAQRLISPSCAVAVNPWELHGYVPDSSEGQYILVLYIRPSWLRDQRPGHPDGLRFGQVPITVTPDILSRVEQLTHILSDGHGAELFDRLLYELTEACFVLSHGSCADDRQPAISVNDFRVRKSLRLIAERLGDDFDVAKLASDSGLSRPHFFKIFRNQIGVPPKLFWNTLRLERAFHELVETSKPICDISFELGFSSQSSFSRFFCLNTGLAPTDYRRVGHVVASPLSHALDVH